MAHAEYCTECICAEPEMCDLAQKLQAVFFRLQGKLFSITVAKYFDRCCFQLYFLSLTQRWNDLSDSFYTGSCGDPFKYSFVEISKRGYNLKITDGASII